MALSLAFYLLASSVYQFVSLKAKSLEVKCYDENSSPPDKEEKQTVHELAHKLA